MSVLHANWCFWSSETNAFDHVYVDKRLDGSRCHLVRSRPRPHCVRWVPSSPLRKGHSPQFLAHVCSGQTAGWTKMSLGTEVGFGPGHIVLYWDPAPPPPKGTAPIFGPCLVATRSPTATAELLFLFPPHFSRTLGRFLRNVATRCGVS